MAKHGKDAQEAKHAARGAEAPESVDLKKAKRTKEQQREERKKEKNAKKLEKLMRRKQRREEHSDRKTLSYEDMPLEERPREKRPAHALNRKRVTLAIVILMITFIVVFLFANSDRLSVHNIINFFQYGVFNRDSEERFPVNIQDENITQGNFKRMGQDLCYASDTRVQILNNYGKSVFSEQHGYTSPVLVTCSKYSLVYSLGGTGFQIASNEEALYVGTAENNILVADIVDNGSYLLVTQSEGYLSKLYAYNKDNEQIYAYSFADYYVTSATLSAGGTYAVVSGLSALNGDEISSLYVLDFTKESPAHMQEFEENIIYEVSYLNDTYACAIGKTAAYVINTRNGNVTASDYNGRTLTAYTINTDTHTFSLSLSRSGDGRNCDILSYYTNGKPARSFETDLRVISLSSYKGRIALLTPDALYLYNKDGGLVSKKDAGLDPHAVVLYTSADAYVLDTSEIRSVSM